jgi:hypothetical protein
MDTVKATPEPDDRHSGTVAQRHWPRTALEAECVQGVTIESRPPTIAARDAIRKAGFDPEAGWIIVLKVAGGTIT